jgi:hypothetical protein
MKITFHNEESHEAYHSMAEGMSEVALDDNATARAQALDSAIAETAYADGMSYPVTFTLNASAHIARDIIGNIDDNEESTIWITLT